MFTDLNRLVTARSGVPGSGQGSVTKVLRRETIAAWLVGAGVWLAGLGFLAMQTAPPAFAGSLSDATAPTAYYELSTANTYVQDITGRYTVVVRKFRQVVCG